MSITKLKARARQHEQREEWDRAIQLYTEALDLSGDQEGEIDPALLNRVGDLHLRLGNLPNAVEYYDRAVDRYSDAGLFNNAIALCSKAIRYQPEQVDLYRKLGRLCAQQGFITDARRWFLEFAQRQSRAGAIDESLDALEEFASLTDDAEVWEQLADQLLGRERQVEALDALTRAYVFRARDGEEQEAARLEARILEIDPGAPIDTMVEVVAEQQTGEAAGTGPSGRIGAQPAGGEGVESPAVAGDVGEEAPVPGASQTGDAGVEVEELPAAPPDEERAEAGSETWTPTTPGEPAPEWPESADGPSAVEGLETSVEFKGEWEDKQEAPGPEPDGASPAGVDVGPAGGDVEPPAGAAPDQDWAAPEEPPSWEEEEPLSTEEGEGEAESAAWEPEEPSSPEGEVEAEGGSDEGETAPLPLLAPWDGGVTAEGGGEEPTEGAVAEEPLAETPPGQAVGAPPDEEPVNAPSPAAAPSLPQLEEPEPEDDGAVAASPPEGLFGGDEASSEVLEEAAAEQVGAAEPSDESFVDLGDLLADVLPEEESRYTVEAEEPSGDEEADFAEMLAQFRAKVSEHLAVEDTASHYDLGLAYKEMGLLDEAISEFQIALRHGGDRLKVGEELGQCFMDKGNPGIAVRILERIAHQTDVAPEELIGVWYLLGRCYQELGRVEEAKQAYEEVLGVDIAFRDVPERLADL